MSGKYNTEALPASISLPSSEQFYMNSEQGETYLIQISWPLNWQDKSDRKSLPIMYIVDGNAMFLTATESAWRNAFSSDFDEGGIVVGIGYPIHAKLFDLDRRAIDLTPPSEPPLKEFGGADIFLDFIEKSVQPAVKSRLSAISGVSVFEEALFGHSFGGIFVLHALFTRPQSFDCFMASSPSIWWNEMSMMDEARAFAKSKESLEKAPSLMIFWGSLEQNPVRLNDESLGDYEEKKKSAAITRMADNALDLYSMLKTCGHLRALMKHEFEGEDHTSVMACSVSRSLAMFFENWPVRRTLSEVAGTAPSDA